MHGMVPNIFVIERPDIQSKEECLSVVCKFRPSGLRAFVDCARREARKANPFDLDTVPPSILFCYSSQPQARISSRLGRGSDRLTKDRRPRGHPPTAPPSSVTLRPSRPRPLLEASHVAHPSSPRLILSNGRPAFQPRHASSLPFRRLQLEFRRRSRRSLPSSSSSESLPSSPNAIRPSTQPLCHPIHLVHPTPTNPL